MEWWRRPWHDFVYGASDCIAGDVVWDIGPAHSCRGAAKLAGVGPQQRLQLPRLTSAHATERDDDESHEYYRIIVVLRLYVTTVQILDTM